jgi:hypothetical protein
MLLSAYLRLGSFTENLGRSCRCASYSWQVKDLRHPSCAYLRPNCHANPISWLAPGFAGSNLICPARQSGVCGAYPLAELLIHRR